MRKRFRDAEGNVLIVQTTPSGELAFYTPGKAVHFPADQLEGIRQTVADGRADLLRGQRWSR